MNSIFKKVAGLRRASLAVALGILLAACQSANGGSSNNTQSVPQAANIGGAFSDYHATYNQIIGTLVTIDKVFVRTNDGRRLRVKFKRDNVPSVAPSLSPVVLDLQKLTGVNSSTLVSQGLVISLRDLELPATVTSLDIVEIETHLRGGIHNELDFSDQNSCKLKAHRDLVFYTRQLFTVDVGADYIVKIKFDTLNSIQLACHKKKKHAYHNCICNQEDDDHVHANNNSSNNRHRCDDEPDDNTCNLSCTLASQREEIVNIINVADEF